MHQFEVSGKLVDIVGKKIRKAIIKVNNGIIISVEDANEVDDCYILPGFIDSHVHIESSMLVPSEFAKLAVNHGTVATVSDPHEIANVLGLDGVNFMIENGKSVPFKFYFGAPSCVPATTFETAGAEISLKDIDTLFQNPEVKYLAEMMNWPGVLFGDPVVYEKIALAKKYNRVVDGHAPGLKGEQAKKYASAGISTDHECFMLEEALDKLAFGMKILIREGSAAKNFEALIELLNTHEDDIMLCSDDKHPDSLVLGHINDLVKRALAKGIDVYKVLKAACINPVNHYKLDVGLLRKGDSADFIMVDNLKDFNILKTFIKGLIVSENGVSNIFTNPVIPINNFKASLKEVKDFTYHSEKGEVNVIEALNEQIITGALGENLKVVDGVILSDAERDILKITVVNRYQDTKPALAFIKGFGLKEGAIASSVAHDSHNIVAVGADDESICKAVNEVIKNKGGIAAVRNNVVHSLPLPVAGLMSTENGLLVASRYTEMDKISKAMGSKLTSPFMTLSFMALLVIPKLKLSDKGLFDGESFRFV